MSSFRSRATRSQRVFVALAATSILLALTTLLAPTAWAGTTTSIEFPGVATCEVRADDPHYSTTVVGDVSGRGSVDCRAPGGAKVFASSIRVDSELSYYMIPLFGETLKNCSALKSNRFSLDLPCHGRWQDSGYYTIDVRATVVLGGETKSASASETVFISGGQGGPWA